MRSTPTFAVVFLVSSALSCAALPPDPASLWALTVTNGSVASRNASGNTWDTIGGAPDPVVCLTFDGRRTCTGESADTYSPTWNFTFPTTSARVLQAGMLVEFYDNDTVGGEAICTTTTIPVSNGDFASNSGRITCGGSSFNYTLSAR